MESTTGATTAATGPTVRRSSSSSGAATRSCTTSDQASATASDDSNRSSSSSAAGAEHLDLLAVGVRTKQGGERARLQNKTIRESTSLEAVWKGGPLRFELATHVVDAQ
jgi:hypothetical protein